MKIPLAKPFYDENLTQIFDSILKSRLLVRNKYNKEFEENWAKYCDQKYAIAVNSGTFAILAVLASYNLKKGDQIILPSHTFIATALAIKLLGLDPIFIDVYEDDFCINVEEIKSKITQRTRGIIVVDLYGNSAKMDAIREIATSNNLFVLEDACQAHGLVYKGKKPGYFSDTAVYSFYPSKNLSVLGEGGIITTNNEEIFKKCKAFRDYGKLGGENSNYLGLNGSLSEIHAAIGNYQIKFLDSWNKRRHQIAELYTKELTEYPSEPNLIIPYLKDDIYQTFHLFVIRTNSKYRNELMNYLSNHDIQTKIHYPIPVHKQEIFNEYSNLSLPVTEKICNEILSLPMSQFFTDEEIFYVIENIKKFFKEKGI